MPRRLLFAVALAATLLAACGGPANAPALTDPKDILAKAVSSLQDVKTAHVRVTLAGKIDTGLVTGASGGLPVDLTGATLEGDIDRAGSGFKLSAAVPSLFGVTADIVATGGTAWARTSLNPDGKYHPIDVGAIMGALPLPSLPSVPATSASPDPSAVAALLDRVKSELDKLATPPTKLADEKIGDQDCYHVQATISPSDVPQASAALSSGSVTLDVWTRKSDYRPARVVIAVDAGTQGNLTATIDLSAYDASLTIAPPPADQVSDQPFSIPGLLP
jgi:hypothetical protein